MNGSAHPIPIKAADASIAIALQPVSWQQRALWAGLGLVTVLLFALSMAGDGPTVPVMGAVALASTLSSIAGFAFSAICGAMLFHLDANRVQIVQIMIACSIANQAAMVWSLRKAVRWRQLGIFLFGGMLGLPIGIGVLLYLHHYVYTCALGVFLLAYGGYMLMRRPLVVRHQPVVFDALAGFLGGITGGAVGFPGAAVTIWCGLKGWSKAQQRAVYQPFILLMQIVALVAISLVRQSGGRVGFNPEDLFCVPPGLVGTALGMLFYRRLSDAHFGRIVNVLLIVSGLSYIM